MAHISLLLNFALALISANTPTTIPYYIHKQLVFLNEIVTIPLGRICVMVHFLLSSLSWCFLMGSDKFCSSIIAQKLWAIEPKRFPFSIWIIVNEPIQCSPSNAHGPRPCYSLIWAKLLSSVKRTRKYGWPLCNLMLTYFYRLFFFRTITFLKPKNKTVIVQKFLFTNITLRTPSTEQKNVGFLNCWNIW